MFSAKYRQRKGGKGGTVSAHLSLIMPRFQLCSRLALYHIYTIYYISSILFYFLLFYFPSSKHTRMRARTHTHFPAFHLSYQWQAGNRSEIRKRPSQYKVRWSNTQAGHSLTRLSANNGKHAAQPGKREGWTMRRISPFKDITGPAAVTVGFRRVPFVPPRCGGEDYSNVG